MFLLQAVVLVQDHLEMVDPEVQEVVEIKLMLEDQEMILQHVLLMEQLKELMAAMVVLLLVKPEAVAEEQTQLEQLVVVLVQQQLETVELENQIQFLDQT